MIYDRDLKWMARIISALMVVNAGAAIGSAWRHAWWDAAASVLWLSNLWTWRAMNKATQRTRDAGRLIEAAVLKVMENDRRY